MRLGMLYLTTCVGLRYGWSQPDAEWLFLEVWRQSLCVTFGDSSLSALGVWCKKPDLPNFSAYDLEPGLPSPG